MSFRRRDKSDMKNLQHILSRTAVIAMAFLCTMALWSCKKKNDSNVIIVQKPIVVKARSPQKTGDASSVHQIKWMGGSYKIENNLKADTSLPLTSDGVDKFYDNRVSIRILRSDGAEFFSGTFTKQNFKPYVDSSYYKNGALLGIVFDKVNGNLLRFAASVGSPDMSSDEYVPLVLTVNKLGTVSIAKDQEADTSTIEN